MAPDTPSPQDETPWAALLVAYLRLHIMVFAGVVVCALGLNFASPADRGLFIPILLWGVLVLAHYLFVRAINTDPAWVEERSEQITMNASDLSHIENIRERHEQRMAKDDEKRLDTTDKNERAS